MQKIKHFKSPLKFKNLSGKAGNFPLSRLNYILSLEIAFNGVKTRLHNSTGHIMPFYKTQEAFQVKNSYPQPVTGNSPVNYSILKYALITRIHGITGHIEPLTKGMGI